MARKGCMNTITDILFEEKWNHKLPDKRYIPKSLQKRVSYTTAIVKNSIISLLFWVFDHHCWLRNHLLIYRLIKRCSTGRNRNACECCRSKNLCDLQCDYYDLMAVRIPGCKRYIRFQVKFWKSRSEFYWWLEKWVNYKNFVRI